MLRCVRLPDQRLAAEFLGLARYPDIRANESPVRRSGARLTIIHPLASLVWIGGLTFGNIRSGRGADGKNQNHRRMKQAHVVS